MSYVVITGLQQWVASINGRVPF